MSQLGFYEDLLRQDEIIGDDLVNLAIKLTNRIVRHIEIMAERYEFIDECTIYERRSDEVRLSKEVTATLPEVFTKLFDRLSSDTRATIADLVVTYLLRTHSRWREVKHIEADGPRTIVQLVGIVEDIDPKLMQLALLRIKKRKHLYSISEHDSSRRGKGK